VNKNDRFDNNKMASTDFSELQSYYTSHHVESETVHFVWKDHDAYGQPELVVSGPLRSKEETRAFSRLVWAVYNGKELYTDGDYYKAPIEGNWYASKDYPKDLLDKDLKMLSRFKMDGIHKFMPSEWVNVYIETIDPSKTPFVLFPRYDEGIGFRPFSSIGTEELGLMLRTKNFAIFDIRAWKWVIQERVKKGYAPYETKERIDADLKAKINPILVKPKLELGGEQSAEYSFESLIKDH
jgi:hypothetical protein